jgi:hypothetical protein
MTKTISAIVAAVLILPGTMPAQEQPPANPHHTPAVQPVPPSNQHHVPAVKPAGFILPASGQLSEPDFLKLLNVRCARCHAQRIKDMGAIKANKWIEPGKPDKSPIYTVIGKHKKPDGTYHNLSVPEKQAISDFIVNLKP